MPDRGSLIQARSTLAEARANRDALVAQVAAVSKQGQQLARTLPPNDERLAAFKEREQSLQSQLTDSHARVRAAQAGLNQQIERFLGEGDVDFLSLSASLPIALFPIRIETRFFGAPGRGGELRIRVYPDEILANSHEPGLTPTE